ncbi:MAG: diguanylate cyclase [Myxococcota bacterium]
MRLLLADDDKISALRLRRLLETWGYEVEAVNDGERALAGLSKPTAPKLAILDWMMPGLRGPEIIRRLRLEGDSRDYQYIILLTSRNDQSDVVAGLEAGADDYLTKPVHKAELRARLRVGRRLLETQRRLLETQEKLRIQASQDALTQLPNRRSMMACLENAIVTSHADGSPVGLLMLDLDRFKGINDTYGHGAGDAVLQESARRMLSAIRSQDTIGRFGGEEFLAVLPNADRDGVAQVGERLRANIAGEPLLYGSITIPFSCSLGGAVYMPGEASSQHSLIQAADQALYAAKAAGRNRVCFAWANSIDGRLTA